MHSDWFNEIEILQSRWQHGEKVGYCYHSGLEKTTTINRTNKMHSSLKIF
jgi:hypothetical protein